MLVTKRMATTSVDVERLRGRDGSSARLYEPLIRIDAHVMRKDEVVKALDGTEIDTQYTVFVDGGQAYLPAHGDRLTFTPAFDDDEHTAVVEMRDERRPIRGTVVDHVKLFAREE